MLGKSVAIHVDQVAPRPPTPGQPMSDRSLDECVAIGGWQREPGLKRAPRIHVHDARPRIHLKRGRLWAAHEVRPWTPRDVDAAVHVDVERSIQRTLPARHQRPTTLGIPWRARVASRVVRREREPPREPVDGGSQAIALSGCRRIEAKLGAQVEESLRDSTRRALVRRERPRIVERAVAVEIDERGVAANVVPRRNQGVRPAISVKGAASANDRRFVRCQPGVGLLATLVADELTRAGSTEDDPPQRALVRSSEVSSAEDHVEVSVPIDVRDRMCRRDHCTTTARR